MAEQGGIKRNFQQTSALTYIMLAKSKSRRETLVIACPQCGMRILLQVDKARIDECGFENHDCECSACGFLFSGIIDPYDEAFPHSFDHKSRLPPRYFRFTPNAASTFGASCGAQQVAFETGETGHQRRFRPT